MDLEKTHLFEQALRKRRQELLEEQTQEEREERIWLEKYIKGQCSFEQLPVPIRYRIRAGVTHPTKL